MKKLAIILTALILLLCACGAPATNEFPSTGQEAATVQNTTTDGRDKEAIELTEAAVEETEESIYENDLTRKTFAVEVRFVVSTADGNTKTLETEAKAVEYHNDMAEPWFNLVSGVNPGEIKEIWLRADETVLVDHVNCCQCYSDDENGWFRIDCLQERHNGMMQMDEPYTYQMVSTNEDGNACYVTFVYVTEDTASVTEVVQPAAEETEPSYEYENDPTDETFAVEVCFVLAASDGTTYKVEKQIRASGPVVDDVEPHWYNDMDVNVEDIQEIRFRSEELTIERIYCTCCETFERGEDGWFRLNFHHKVEYGGFERDPEWPYHYQLIVNVGNGEVSDRYVTLVYSK